MRPMTVLTALFLVPLCQAAPAPTPRPARKQVRPAAPPHAGSWRITWGRSQGDAVFHKDGGYWCRWAGQQWVGHWELTAGRLVVTEGRVLERPDSVPGPPSVWSVQLDPTGLAGTVVHEGRQYEFRLTGPAEKPRPEPAVD